jgi:glycosyltransferase involved in cell wall biosynthesis
MSKGLKIKFTGFLKDQIDVYKYISKSKIFMMLSEREGFSIVTLEALALGIPVICYNNKNNTAKNLINSNNGRLINSLKATEITRLIEKIIQNYAQYTVGAKESAIKYYLENIIHLLINIYER